MALIKHISGLLPRLVRAWRRRFASVGIIGKVPLAATSPLFACWLCSIPGIAQPPTATSASAANCDPAYPDVRIPPPPPDLDCGQISYRNFRVLLPDPHRFDGDNDGI